VIGFKKVFRDQFIKVQIRTKYSVFSEQRKKSIQCLNYKYEISRFIGISKIIFNGDENF
jgi:hypothetical protein